MKTNQKLKHKKNSFKVKYRIKDYFFNATDLINQWNIVLNTKFSIDDFISKYVSASAYGTFVDKCGEDVYLLMTLEPQLRFYVAGYNIEIYNQLNPEEVVYEIKCPLQNNASDNFSPTTTKTYLMIDEASGAVKIGRSHDPKFREHTLCAQIPRIKLLAVCPKDVERNLHNKYKSKRMRGEWFNLTDDDIESIIKEYKFIKHTPKLFATTRE